MQAVADLHDTLLRKLICHKMAPAGLRGVVLIFQEVPFHASASVATVFEKLL